MSGGVRRPFYRRAGRKARLLINKTYEEARDALVGVRTHVPPLASALNAADLDQGYEPLSYRGLDRIGRRLALRPDEVVYDLGCGMGRATCFFARQPIARSVGVEFDAGLAAAARRNAKTLRDRRAPIEIVEGDAARQAYADASLIFMFNPFSDMVLRPVLDRVDADRQGRPLRIVYANPMHGAVLDATPWLEKVDRFVVPQYLSKAEVGVWRTR